MSAEERREDTIRDENWGLVRWVRSDLRRPDRLAARVRRAGDPALLQGR